jgi:hypothetical protein
MPLSSAMPLQLVATALISTMVFLGGIYGLLGVHFIAAFQVLTGKIIDHAGRLGELYSLSGFKSAFIACLAGVAICLVLSLLIKGKPASGD